MRFARLYLPLLALPLTLLACTDDGGGGDTTDETETSGDGDGDGDAGDGDGDAGDGDGDAGDGDGDTTGDGDGDGDTGDGDGDGDGDTTGDGDGDPVECGADPGWGQVAVGQPIKHAAAIDHEGNERNICEWGGTPIAIDLSAMWCGPCHMASQYLAGSGGDPFGGIGPQLRDMIDSGSAVWLTFLVQDENGAPANQDHGAAWDAMYHHPNIPVLTEMDTQMLTDNLAPGCWPTAWVVDPDLNFFALDDCQSWNHLAQMVQTFGP